MLFCLVQNGKNLKAKENTKMKYLREVSEEIKMLIEESDQMDSTGKKIKNYFLTGVYTESDTWNKNKRKYPEQILIKEIARYNEEAIGKNRAVGELGHPPEINLNLDRVSHTVTELKQNGKQFMGKAKVLDTPMGKICKTFMDEGIPMGISSRAAGSVQQSHYGDVVQEDLHIVAFDVVHDPSCAAAMMEGILESREYYLESGILKPRQMEKIQTKIKKATKSQLSEGLLLKIFEEIMRKI